MTEDWNEWKNTPDESDSDDWVPLDTTTVKPQILWYDRKDGRQKYSNEQENEALIFPKKVGGKKAGADSVEKTTAVLTGKHASKIVRLERFTSFPMHPVLMDNLFNRCHYEMPTDIQKNSFPVIFSGRDLVASSQTGSGKTCAFMVPIIQLMLTTGPPEVYRRDNRTSLSAPLVLVLAPTRELAVQIYDESRKFAFKTGIRCCCVYGGQESRIQSEEIKKGLDILVATPGRLVDMYDNWRFTLALVKYLVFDEGDRMLDMGFEPQVRRILQDTNLSRDLPAGTHRQSMLFSATFPKIVEELAESFLRNPMVLHVGSVGSTSKNITQKLYHVENDENKKYDMLKKIIMDESSTDATGAGRILVFVETKAKCETLQRNLFGDGFNVSSIHGDRTQPERETALQAFRDGVITILVATGVMARGLDIPAVNLVIQYEVSRDITEYTHRIGRTGRAGRQGKAISFLSNHSLQNAPFYSALKELLEQANQAIPDWFADVCNNNRGPSGFSANRPSARGSAKSIRAHRDAECKKELNGLGLNVDKKKNPIEAVGKDGWDDSDLE